MFFFGFFLSKCDMSIYLPIIAINKWINTFIKKIINSLLRYKYMSELKYVKCLFAFDHLTPRQTKKIAYILKITFSVSFLININSLLVTNKVIKCSCADRVRSACRPFNAVKLLFKLQYLFIFCYICYGTRFPLLMLLKNNYNSSLSVNAAVYVFKQTLE